MSSVCLSLNHKCRDQMPIAFYSFQSAPTFPYALLNRLLKKWNSFQSRLDFLKSLDRKFWEPHPSIENNFQSKKWSEERIHNSWKPDEPLAFFFKRGWSVLKEIFCDPNFQDKIHTSFKPKFDQSGNRIWGSIEGGRYMEHLQTKIPRECTPLIYNVFSDGTNVQKFGSLSYHPIFMTLGNLHSDARKQDNSYRLVGLIPALEGSKTEKANEKFREAKASIFQDCFQMLMSSFDDPSRKFASPFFSPVISTTQLEKMFTK